MKLKSIKRLVPSLLLLFALTAVGQTQSLEETLQVLSQDAAAKYLNPVSSAYGTNLNSGWFHRAPDAKVLGVDLEVGLVAMGAFFDNKNKHFSTSGSFRFGEDEALQLAATATSDANLQQALAREIMSRDHEVEISGATIIGDKNDYITIAYPSQSYTVNGQSVTVPTQDVVLDIGGFKALADAKLLPLAAPQFSIGTVYGTQATFRWLPKTRIDDDLGDFSYFGFGLQHNPAVWLPLPLPLNVAASFYTQTLKIGDMFESKATAFGLNISKQLGFDALNLTPYAGFMVESSTMRVQYQMIYDQNADPIPVDFELDGENTSRAVLGLSVRFMLININADYNLGQYNAFSAGVSIRI